MEAYLYTCRSCSSGVTTLLRRYPRLEGIDQRGTLRGRILCLRSRSGPVLASCTTIVHIELLQLVVPEQLPDAVVEQDIEGRVGRVAPPVCDGPLPGPEVCLAMVLSDPHPLADLRFFGPH